MDLAFAKESAVAAARAAGSLLRAGVSEQKTINRKSSAIDLQTEYDQAAEQLIIERLSSIFPEHRMVAEEGGNNGNHQVGTEFIWYIDPLDGTNNFSHGFPVFAVSLALYQADQPLVGVVYDPLRDECFHAVLHEGAYLTSGGRTVRLGVSRSASLVDSLLGTGFPYDRHHNSEDNVAQFTAFLKRAQGVRRGGAAALDLAYVAAGRLDGFWEFRLSSWDCAAGVLLIQEAGGVVTAMDGRPFDLNGKVSLVAGNPQVHPLMLEVLARIVNRTVATD